MFKQDLTILSAVMFTATMISCLFAHVSAGIIPALVVSVTLAALLALSLKVGRKIIERITK